MSGEPRRLFWLAVVGCFALAFGATYGFELAAVWVMEIRLKMPYLDVANIMVTTWRLISSLMIALLLCIWLGRR